jgi:hypothetical protein
VKLIKTQRIRNVQNRDNGAGQTESKANEIQNAVDFIAPKVSESYFEKVGIHDLGLIVSLMIL